MEQPTLTLWASGGNVDDSALCLCRDQVEVDVARNAGYNLSPVYHDILFLLAYRDGVVELQGLTTWPKSFPGLSHTLAVHARRWKLGVVTSSSEPGPDPYDAMQHRTSQETGRSRRQPIAIASVDRSLLGIVSSEALNHAWHRSTAPQQHLRGKDLMTKRRPMLRLSPTLSCPNRLKIVHSTRRMSQNCRASILTLFNALCNINKRQMRLSTTTFGPMEVRDVIEQNYMHLNKRSVATLCQTGRRSRFISAISCFRPPIHVMGSFQHGPTTLYHSVALNLRSRLGRVAFALPPPCPQASFAFSFLLNLNATFENTTCCRYV